MADEPKVHVAISLTTSTFRISDENSAKPSVIAKSTLITPKVLTVEARGERDAGTVLGNPPMEALKFRVEIFDFHDVLTDELVIHDLYPGSCEPGEEFLELDASQPRVTKTLLNEISPWSDPVNLLKPGHTYRVTLRPQVVKCWSGSIDDLLARREIVPSREGKEEEEKEAGQPDYNDYHYPEPFELTLASDDFLILTVEE